eukprot:349851-Chlamydomonas_euryale.AAC.3
MGSKDANRAIRKRTLADAAADAAPDRGAAADGDAADEGDAAPSKAMENPWSDVVRRIQTLPVPTVL